MKFQRIVFFCFVLMSFNFLAQNPTYRAEKEKTNDLVHTKLKVDFNFADKTMNGEAWITAKPHFYSTDKITLDANSMIIHQVALNNQKLDFNYDDFDLIIDLPNAFIHRIYANYSNHIQASNFIQRFYIRDANHRIVELSLTNS